MHFPSAFLFNHLQEKMDYHYFKDKLNRLYDRYIDGKNRPTFFDINQGFTSLSEITKNYEIIKAECENALKNTPHLPRYHDIDPGESEISDTTEKNWNVFMLHLLGYQLPQAKALCPHTFNLLKRIPGLIQAFFSILEPGKSIPLHEGPYRGYLRYHLGLQIPKDNPPQIIVNKQPHTWQEGKAVLFDDSWPHEVKNISQERRIVLIIDILRPMPFLPDLINRFVTFIIARYFYGRPVIKKATLFGKNIRPLMQ